MVGPPDCGVSFSTFRDVRPFFIQFVVAVFGICFFYFAFFAFFAFSFLFFYFLFSRFRYVFWSWLWATQRK